MKNRNIPFGYCYQNGTIIIHPDEKAVIDEIVEAYLSGQSLLKIANELNARGVEFTPGVIGWNKARLKRILEDERYLGESYPAILEQSVYDAVQSVKEQRNTQKTVDRKADIFQIAIPVRCPACGSEMFRRHDKRISGCSERWTCRNEDCRTLIAISDEELIGEITERMNTAIAHPDGIVIPQPKEHEPNAELQRLNNDISRTLEGFTIQKETLKEQLLKSVSLKYTEIDHKIHIAKKLKMALENASPLTEFSADMLGKTANAILLGTDKAVSIILTNGQQIGKEITDGNSGSTTADTGSTQNTAYH